MRRRGQRARDRGQVDVGEKEAGRNVRFTRASDGRKDIMSAAGGSFRQL